VYSRRKDLFDVSYLLSDMSNGGCCVGGWENQLDVADKYVDAERSRVVPGFGFLSESGGVVRMCVELYATHRES
jgi:hypothetical protein